MTNRRNSVPRRKSTDRRVSDRRFDSRLTSRASIRFLRAGTTADEILLGKLLDVSTTGIRILLENPPTISEKLLVEVRDAQNRCFNMTAQVIWSEPVDDGRHHVGCELCVELSPRQYALLEELASDADSN